MTSRSQVSRHSAKRAYRRFANQFHKFLNKERIDPPSFSVDNPYIRQFIENLRLDPDDYYTGSDKYKAKLRERNREYQRNYYKTKTEVEQNRRVQERGPNRTKYNGKNYMELSDEEKWKVCMEHEKKKEVREGYRCFVCKEYFTEEEVTELNHPNREQIEYYHEKRDKTYTIYVHPECWENRYVRLSDNSVNAEDRVSSKSI